MVVSRDFEVDALHVKTSSSWSGTSATFEQRMIVHESVNIFVASGADNVIEEIHEVDTKF